MMTKEDFAQQITMRAYTEEMTDAEKIQARDAGLVVIFGRSDDITVLAGAIDEAFYDGKPIMLNPQGALSGLNDGDTYEFNNLSDMEACVDQLRYSKPVKAIWHNSPSEYCWTFETDIPHATFEVIDGEESYCLGIVIDMKDLAVEEMPIPFPSMKPDGIAFRLNEYPSIHDQFMMAALTGLVGHKLAPKSAGEVARDYAKFAMEARKK